MRTPSPVEDKTSTSDHSGFALRYRFVASYFFFQKKYNFNLLIQKGCITNFYFALYINCYFYCCYYIQLFIPYLYFKKP